MAGINSKLKGNRGELECTKILNERFGKGKKVFARVPSSGAWGGGQNRSSREDMSLEQRITLVADIMTPPEFKFVLEHKNYESMNFWSLFNSSSEINSWIEQVQGDADFVGKKPMLIMKFNQKKRLAMIQEQRDNYVFEWKGWYCYWLTDLLKEHDDFFMEQK